MDGGAARSSGAGNLIVRMGVLLGWWCCLGEFFARGRFFQMFLRPCFDTPPPPLFLRRVHDCSRVLLLRGTPGVRATEAAESTMCAPCHSFLENKCPPPNRPTCSNFCPQQQKHLLLFLAPWHQGLLLLVSCLSACVSVLDAGYLYNKKSRKRDPKLPCMYDMSETIWETGRARTQLNLLTAYPTHDYLYHGWACARGRGKKRKEHTSSPSQ